MTQKGYRCYNLSTRKYYMSDDITFFDSISYFSSDSLGILSALVPLPPSVPLSSPKPTIDATALRSQSECTEQPAPKLLQMFTQWPKVLAPPSVLNDSSPFAGPSPQQFLPLLTLMFPLLFKKVNSLVLIILFLILSLMMSYPLLSLVCPVFVFYINTQII